MDYHYPKEGENAMHVILTGEKQVGKSTLVNIILTALEERKKPFSGLKTVSEFENGDRVVYMIPAGTSRGDIPHERDARKKISNENLSSAPDAPSPIYPEKHRAGVCRAHHLIEKNPEIFNRYGVRYLQSPEKIILIDEVGNLEADAHAYSLEVKSLLERKDVSVLLVLQKMAKTELAEYIRERFTLIEITPQNRDDVCSEILSRLLL